MAAQSSKTGGFSLIELAVVLVFLAVFTVFGLVRFQPAEATLPTQADRLARDIRHMQALALAQGQRLQLVASGLAYRVCPAAATPCDPANAIVDPARGAPFDVALENGVSVSATTLVMDSLGRPLSGGALSAVDVAFTLSGGAQTSAVTVSRLTGFVSVAY